MSIPSRYISIFKRISILFFSILIYNSLLSAQSPTSLILTQPVSQKICKKDYSAQFVVVPKLDHPYVIANPGFTFQYQWYSWTGTNWVAIPTSDAKGPSYTATSEGKYYCEIWYYSIDTKEKSNEVTLTIADAPYIGGIEGIGSQQTGNISLCEGGSLWANASGVQINKSDLEEYTWSLDGVPVKSDAITNNTVPGLVYPNVDLSKTETNLEIAVKNGCGTTTAQRIIHVWITPPVPTPIAKEYYCQGEKADPLKTVEENNVKWFDDAVGAERPNAPTPNTTIIGTQSWWVLQWIRYHDQAICESDRRKVTVEVFAVPDPPKTVKDTVLCLNDPSFTLKAQGSGTIQWYNDKQNPIPTAPQINTSTAGPQIFHVTQNNGKCESRIDDGKITVKITDRSETNRMNLQDSIDLCPNNYTTITASSQMTNPVFKWYKKDNKTDLLQVGPTFQTPVLMRDTIYYVTITYGDLCESSYPRATVVYVRDLTYPEIKAPPNLLISTDPGVCHAANVDIGYPELYDNCTSAQNLVVYTDIYHPGVFPKYYSLGDTTLVWWARDEAGNASRSLQTISVRDREAPGINKCPGDITVEINDNETSAVVFYQLEYSDNCTPFSELIDSLAWGRPSGSVFDLGTTPVKRLIIDKAENIATCEFNVVVQYPYRVMEVTLNVSKTRICPGEQVLITPMINGGSGRYTYTWKSPRYWTEPEMRDYPLDDVTYELTVSDGVTSETRSVQVTVLDTRQVELTLEGHPMDQILEGDEVLVTATSGFASYKLLLNNEVMQTSGLNNGISFQAELGTYVVRVFATDFSDCVTQDQMEIVVDSRKLPNVFTPNFDGKNDIFLKGFDLEVYSRSGQLLYKGVDGWDGTFKGKMMPQGTYFYTVRRIMNNGELRIFTNTVTLKL